MYIPPAKNKKCVTEATHEKRSLTFVCSTTHPFRARHQDIRFCRTYARMDYIVVLQIYCITLLCVLQEGIFGWEIFLTRTVAVYVHPAAHKQGAHLIKVPQTAKMLDEPIAFFEQAVYNTCNKSAENGKNIRRRAPWRSKEMCI